MTPTIGLSDFYLNNSTRENGQSYTTLDYVYFIELVRDNWEKRRAGAGEGTNLNRKVLVPIEGNDLLYHHAQPAFFCPCYVPLSVGMPVRAEVTQRQDGEHPHIQTFITPEDAKHYMRLSPSAKHVDVVCYSAEALLENGGKRSTEREWEIVTILCSDDVEEPMHPLAMARNFLGMPGGTKSNYTAKEFAEAIWHHLGGVRGLKIKQPAKVKKVDTCPACGTELIATDKGFLPSTANCQTCNPLP